MAVSLPNIDIVFKQLANTLINRSSRANAILIIRDDTDKTFKTKEYELESEVEKDSKLYTAENLQYIRDTWLGLPGKVTVVRIDKTGGNIGDALSIVAGLESTGWVGIADGTTTNEEGQTDNTEEDALSTWIKQMEQQKKTFKAVVFNPTTPPDCKHIVILNNPKVIFNGSRGEQTGDKFVPTLLGYLAGANVEKGTTYLEMKNLKSVIQPADVNAALTSGQLVLINDEGKVKIGLGINSLTTLDEKNTEDERYIEIVEAQDMILDDIRSNFKNNYIGKYKNKLDNQIIFVSAVNTYLKELEGQSVLDDEFTNKADIDVDAQRKAWITTNADAAKWSDAKVRQNAYKRQMFLSGNIKILFSMTDLSFTINMQQ